MVQKLVTIFLAAIPVSYTHLDVYKRQVRDPAGEDLSQAIGTIELESGCISTSGSYEKSFVQDGVTYHHILDPKTGYPAQSGLVSVTVIQESGAMADILSTACFVLGIEGSKELLAAHDAAGIFVDTESRVTLVGEVNFTLESSDYTLAG